MIDYISAKEHGVAAKPPHLPWNNERALDKYRFNKPIRAYSEEDLTRISHDIAEQAKRDLNTFTVGKRSPFSVIATAAAANVTKHVGVESVTVKAKKKKMEREKYKAERQKKRMQEIEKELDLYEKEVNLGSELRQKAAMYRGKSAKAIAQTLLEESRRNVQNERMYKPDFQASRTLVNRDYTNLSKNVLAKALMESKAMNSCDSRVTESITETVRVRETSPTTCVVRINTELPAIDNSYLNQLNELKETVKQFDDLSVYILNDSRWDLNKLGVHVLCNTNF